ncbi:D-alpha,beta-D-heptose 1,7-bisphosphate phosphatase [Aquisalimonas asiatica]|uniref:D,D-heptose 1,7-bisphosphate phosphatase n=2 Tax=Aquisalimonas asiatica TaxID=406100 RepID=A0A1H8UCM7_9GAMM|nr:D-alpha,beta-D-heptose 1,7-bisphosphate phosphatase [Aquisalimonas asiatica]
MLDRDGVINADSDAYIKSVDEWHPLPGSLEAMARLSRAGWVIAVCTNQSGVGRGLFTDATVNAIHAELQRQLAPLGGHVDGFFYCPHPPEADCSCRKPKPGLLIQAAAALSFPLQGVPFVGDSRRDMDAARAAGATPVLVRTGKGARTIADGAGLPDWIENDLMAVVTRLLNDD